MPGNDGWIYGLIGLTGGLLGLIGALVSVYFHLRGAKSKRERNFVLGYVAFVLLLTAAYLPCDHYLPFPDNLLVTILYAAVLLRCSFWAWRKMRWFREGARESAS